MKELKNYYELNNDTVIDYLKSKLDYFDDNADIVSQEIGDGNLNLVFRLIDNNSSKSVIIKQALPYVRAAGESWPLDIGRGEIESKILKIEYDLTDGLVPEIYCYDGEMCCMIMEDLKDYVIMRTGVLDLVNYPKFADQITDFMVKTLLLTTDVVVEHKEKKEMVKDFINPELCEITEELVYTEPFGTYERNSMEDFMVDFHKEQLEGDEELKLEVAKLKFEFMNNAQSLLHGDLHTGSIFVNQDNTKVIDPEFAFYGPIAYDVGALIANLIMNYLYTKTREDSDEKVAHEKWLESAIVDCIDMFADKFLKAFKESATDEMAKVDGFDKWYLNEILVGTAGVTGCEMVRRTVGFAHVKDLDCIEDDEKRKWAKQTNILMAKELIKSRSKIVTGKDYLKVIEKFV